MSNSGNCLVGYLDGQGDLVSRSIMGVITEKKMEATIYYLGFRVYGLESWGPSK